MVATIKVPTFVFLKRSPAMESLFANFFNFCIFLCTGHIFWHWWEIGYVNSSKSEEENERRGKKEICKKDRLKEQTNPSIFKLRYMHATKANCSSVQLGTNIAV